jgi:large subunit ribosomal protein L6
MINKTNKKSKQFIPVLKNYNFLIFLNQKISSNYILEFYSNNSIGLKQLDNKKIKLNDTTYITIAQNSLIGGLAPFVKVLIIRGIGYRASIMENLEEFSELPFQKYLSVRVGHSFYLYKPIPDTIGLKILKKDRKLVLYSQDKELVGNFMQHVFNLRPPSVYTGRGIRIKKKVHLRKLGKKDVKKGRAF